MRENIIQLKTIGKDGRIYIKDDWYPGGLPKNVSLSDAVYIDTSYGFASFNSLEKNGLVLGEGSGCYGIVTLLVSRKGKVAVGKFAVLNSTTLICNRSITIGDHCMLAWGSVVTDSWLHLSELPLYARRQLLYDSAKDGKRTFPFSNTPLPVTIEDNCWVGFDAVIMPGVTLGRGCVIGCKTIVTKDVPPYAVVTGSPAKVIKYLKADDTAKVREQAMQEYLKK